MVTMLQVYKSTIYLLVEGCLCIVQANRFLSPWESSRVGIFFGDFIRWRLSAWLHCNGSVLLFL